MRSCCRWSRCLADFLRQQLVLEIANARKAGRVTLIAALASRGTKIGAATATSGRSRHGDHKRPSGRRISQSRRRKNENTMNKLTTAFGAPVVDDNNTMTAGPRGQADFTTPFQKQTVHRA